MKNFQRDLLLFGSIVFWGVGCGSSDSSTGGGAGGAAAGGASASGGGSSGSAGAGASAGTAAVGGNAGTSGNAGSTGGAGAGGAAGAGGSSAAGAGGVSGVLVTSCYKAKDNQCVYYNESNQANVDAQNGLCMSGAGMAGPHCPSMGLVGCCIVVTLGTCYYDATEAAKAMASCPAGKWTTTAP